MNVLIIGSGGREHALVWKILQSKKVKKLYCAPGNAGIAQEAECVNIQPENINGLLSFAKEKKINLTVVGPELPLSLGIVDKFEEEGLRAFGPTASAARLEYSKAFAKEMMAKCNIPTAAFKTFTSSHEAKEYIKEKSAPLVIKADGLAAGKGVVVAESVDEAINAIVDMMDKKNFGEAGKKVVIEDCLKGEEASFMVFTDGTTIVPMVSAQDHKRVFDNDKGPNTGGMGAYSPAPVVTDALADRVIKEVFKPLLSGLKKDGIIYKGVLYAGLMINDNQLNVLEFNCRFGDPEAQPILFRLKSDIIDIMEAIIDNRLSDINVEWKQEASVCVVIASKGYPGNHEKGRVIEGLDEAEEIKGVKVFHAGTAKKDNNIVTTGGRVLGVTALGADIKEAVENAYKAVEKIKFEGMHYRRDIASKALSLVI
ncbi:MAG: phosphoribosylamine--glycine ligase [Nitrospirae bacterium]|nr:phosphoribosylamine--glycine ligase [Nitrospirota bacterium]